MMVITFKQQTFHLLRQKAIYWKDSHALILADLHLGKVTHFRKSGIPVPAFARMPNLIRLDRMLKAIMPDQLLILGDLFHSDWNEEWTEFAELLRLYPNIKTTLVLGNHDILDHSHYLQNGIFLAEQLDMDPFLFTHKPMENIPDGLYNICGHLHPAFRITGKARQTVVLPGFFFGPDQAVIPAFGSFTGTSIKAYDKEDEVYVIAESQIIKLN